MPVCCWRPSILPNAVPYFVLRVLVFGSLIIESSFFALALVYALYLVLMQNSAHRENIRSENRKFCNRKPSAGSLGAKIRTTAELTTFFT